MKIETRGFRITDICPQVPLIDVDSAGEVRLTIVMASTVRAQAADMSPEDFRQFCAAIDAAREMLADRAESAAKADEPASASAPADVLIDAAGDPWYRIPGSDHYSYHSETECRVGGRQHTSFGCGREREDIERNFGPVREAKRLD